MFSSKVFHSVAAAYLNSLCILLANILNLFQNISSLSQTPQCTKASAGSFPYTEISYRHDHAEIYWTYLCLLECSSGTL